MNLHEEIIKAIGAHGMWKTRISQAIATKSSEFTVDGVKVDNQCAFGKFLFGPTISGAVKASPAYGKCVQLHREFHAEASRVLGLALKGEKDAAAQAMAAGSEYARISAALTQAMMEWDRAAV